MSDIRMECQGADIGRWHLPSFALRQGECITLSFPSVAETWTDENPVFRCLTGMESVPGLNLLGTVLVAKPACGPTGWRRLYQKSTTFDWLKKNTTFSDDAIRSFLQDHHMDPKLPLARYAGTPRMILGLAAAFVHRPGVV